MADSLNMGGLSLGPEGQHPRSYIPPHMRGVKPSGQAPPSDPNSYAGPLPGGPVGPQAVNGLNNSAWAG